MKQVLWILLAFVLLCACEEKHFMTDPGYRKMVEQDFQKKKKVLEGNPGNLFAVFDSPMSVEEREALMFLYAYSPLIDLSFSGGDFLLENVRWAFQAREAMPWGKDIPEDIFRHFVLPVRGGKENLDTARIVFYKELKERVATCESMEKAALEVNHWCHEHVIYKPTNARTRSPLATMLTAYGRCGEESIFTLAALRAVGIPARQIYTPRWAHCDDNHAWIEVWVDGEWKYLGACEPEPRLNIAWFTLPVQRAMYVESEVFGKYNGQEEIVYVNESGSGVNVTSHYTRTAPTLVQVIDENGQPVVNAKVEYKIFNYGEFYPVVTLYSDVKGETSLTLGQGDIFVWASKGKKLGFGELSVERQDTLTVVLDKTVGDLFSGEWDLVPPRQHDITALSTDEERAVNDRRFAREDSLRNVYVATFMSRTQGGDVAMELGVDTARFAAYMVASRGNYSELLRFMREVSPERRTLAMNLLGVIAEKDLQDTPADVLLSHVEGDGRDVSNPYFTEYILNPRVQNELLTAYREPVREFLKRHDITDVTSLIQETGKIKVVDSLYPAKVVTPPVGVIRAGVTDALSRNVFFVAACRTMGIPARLSPISGKPEYYQNGTWHTVNFMTEKVVPKGELMLHYAQKTVSDPKYFLNFTIGKLEDGRVRTIDLGSNAAVDMGVGASYKTIFTKPVTLEEGDYLLSTGNRRSDGAVLADLVSFQVEAGKLTNIDMLIRPCVEKMEILGVVPTALSIVPEGKTKPEAIRLPEKGYMAIALIEANKEPTNHLLRDMSGMKDDFENLGVPLYFVFKDADHQAKFNRADFRVFPSVMQWGTDLDGRLLKGLAEGLCLTNTESLPLIVLLNAKGEVVFVSQGYRVGLGTQIMNIISRK
ncbi:MULTISPECIES: transglutaminase-like domain-containing protein [Butyricimonas]|uniref:Transglutaminase-like putative cysteine protease n=1 Tax=Butyricimonas faecihominis TaxID=1472416 RepID=A0A7W6MYB9_9BACT|nr:MULTISPECIES: transglutaminase-like domain-containing protein [Butyricimonas]KAB1501476.1 transglutaminase domain-containing protein [Butyricimonas faecihominis]MBB4025655.1 transglutaminase-like putative cysteine protease [Butyricimonas faecihominis]MBS6689932.1 transglutaminase domain-containing protein [Sanguibacteroides justesenii]WOF07615.1 transglutaminase domain-containing protein [Butyricimonas faecihominis]